VSTVVVFDIGNSHIHACFYAVDAEPEIAAGQDSVERARHSARQARLLDQRSLPNAQAADAATVADWLRAALAELALAELALASVGSASGAGCEPPLAAAICSVVPALASLVGEAARLAYGCEALPLSSTMACGLANQYDQPGRLGTDRLAAAAAARLLFPTGRLVVIDAGTATTVDLVTADDTFAGGYIVPGPGTWLAALRSKTAQLPLVDTAANGVAGDGGAGRVQLAGAGRNTADCIAYGLHDGYPAMLRALLAGLGFAAGDRLVLTGGWASRLGLTEADILQPDLVARGALLMLYLNAARSLLCVTKC